MNDQNIGAIVEKHEKLILHYYTDVQDQARQSFATAKSASKIGFWVLIGTLVYILVFDSLGHFPRIGMTAGTTTIALVGLVSGALIEGVAGIAFWLYARGARQFGAFHICLERTHRYLLAYKIAEHTGVRKEETFKDLVCIMANAPMITRGDIDSDIQLPQARTVGRATLQSVDSGGKPHS
jgi:hypothetical protein